MKYVRSPSSRLLVIVVGFAVGLGVPGGARCQERSVEQTAGAVYAVDTKVSRVYVRVEPNGRGHAHGLAGWFASGTVATDARGKIGGWQSISASLAADDPEARQSRGAGRGCLRT